MLPLSTITTDEALLLDLLEIMLEATLELLGAIDDAGLLLAGTDEGATEEAGLELAATDELGGVTLPILPTPTFAITIAGTSADLSIATV